MRSTHLALLLTVLGTPFAKGQTGYRDPAYIPRVDVAAGYNFVRSNAPPANCNCFGMNGAFASVGVAVWPWLSGAAEVTGGHANNIGPLGQNLTLTTFTAGPRVVMRASRFRTFGQVLFGAAHGGNSYFPRGGTYSTSATSFAYSAGGGVDLHLSHGMDLRPVEVQYLHTGFSNGGNNAEHHLLFGAGVVLKFRGSLWTPGSGRER